MSFVGTLICCGFGGLVFKYGDQKHTLIEIPTTLGIQEYTTGFANAQTKVIKKRAKEAVKSLLPGLSTPGIYLYPIFAYWELLKNTEYLKSTVPIMVVYMVIYAITTVVYFLTILPVYTPLSMVLGPVGLVLAWCHMFLHTNMLTMMTLRMSQMNSFTMYQAMHVRGVQVSYIDVGAQQPVKFYYPMFSGYYLFNHLPWKLAEYLLGFLTLCTLLLVSSIPIAGPFIFHLFVSPFITRIYWAPYLRYLQVNNLQREARFYRHFGQYLAFGLVAGQFESVPLLSAVAYSAHAAAIAQWAQEMPTVET